AHRRRRVVANRHRANAPRRRAPRDRQRGASVVLVGAVSHQLGPGVGLCVLLFAGAGGNALTAVAHGAHHDSVGASTAMFGAIGILGATRVVSRGRRRAARTSWMVVAASLALLALLGTSPGSDLLA